MRRILIAWIAVVFSPGLILGAGFVHNDNFIVFTPADPTQADGQTLAQQILKQAERYRSRVAEEWLGEELPPGVGRSVVNVSFSEDKDAGLTWPKDHPHRKLHNVYLTTTPHRALGSTLAHEIVHVVLATEFPHPDQLPAWAEEGIASKYDDEDRVKVRAQILGWFDRTGNWPRLDSILCADRVHRDDKATYTAVASLTDFLLSRGDRSTLLRFARDGQNVGWDRALQEHYAIADVDELQALWQVSASQ